MSDRLTRAALGALILVIVSGLILMAGLGFYNRLWSDDWCYQRDLTHLGMAGTLGGYFFTGDDAIRGYSTNRYGLTFFTALLALPGQFGTGVIASLIIGAFLIILYLLAGETLLPARATVAARFTLAAFLTYYALVISTARFQVLYWRAGIHYSATLIFGLAFIWLIIRQRRHGTPTALTCVAAFLLGALGGGLSETGSVYLLSAMGMLLIYGVIQGRKDPAWAERAVPLNVTVLMGLLLAMALLILSPSNDRYRVHVDYPIAPSLVPFASIRFALAFMWQSLRGLPLPHLVVFGFAVGLSLVLHPEARETEPLGLRGLLRLTAILVLGTFILITMVQMPAAYFYGAPLDARGQSLSRVTMLLALVVLGWSLGEQLRRPLPAWLSRAAALVLVFIAVYSARFIPPTYSQLDGFVRRAQLWDARDRYIREAVAAGQTRIEVPVIDTYEINTRDMIRSIAMNEWTSNCASAYYGAKAFRAIPP